MVSNHSARNLRLWMTMMFDRCFWKRSHLIFFFQSWMVKVRNPNDARSLRLSCMRVMLFVWVTHWHFNWWMKRVTKGAITHRSLMLCGDWECRKTKRQLMLWNDHLIIVMDAFIIGQITRILNLHLNLMRLPVQLFSEAHHEVEWSH